MPWSATSPELQDTALAGRSRADIPVYRLCPSPTGGYRAETERVAEDALLLGKDMSMIAVTAFIELKREQAREPDAIRGKTAKR